MSRSFCHTLIRGITTAASEKDDKRYWHRRFRQRNRQRVRPGTERLPFAAVSDTCSWRKMGSSV